MTTPFKPSTEQAAGQNPIGKADWTLKDWTSREGTYNEGQPDARSYMAIDFNFVDVDPDPARLAEPYPFPIAKVSINYSNPATSRGNDRWSVFSSSGRRIFGRPFDLDELVGKRMTWAQDPGKLRGVITRKGELGADGQPVEADIWGEVEQPCWQILAIEGVTPAGGNGAAGQPSAVDPNAIYDYLTGLAEGVKEQDWYISLVADQKVTANQAIVGMITSRTLVDNLINMGKLSRDPDGTLHKA